MPSRLLHELCQLDSSFLEPLPLVLSQKLPLEETRKGCWLIWTWQRSWTVCRMELVIGLAPCSLWWLRYSKVKATRIDTILNHSSMFHMDVHWSWSRWHGSGKKTNDLVGCKLPEWRHSTPFFLHAHLSKQSIKMNHARVIYSSWNASSFPSKPNSLGKDKRICGIRTSSNRRKRELKS